MMSLVLISEYVWFFVEKNQSDVIFCPVSSSTIAWPTGGSHRVEFVNTSWRTILILSMAITDERIDNLLSIELKTASTAVENC